MDIQDWFPLGFTSLISLLSKGHRYKNFEHRCKTSQQILAKQSQQYIKRIIHHFPVGLTPRWKDFSIYTDQSMWHTTSTNWRIKTIWSSQSLQKKLLKNSTPLYDKNSPESEYRRPHLNIIKAIYDKHTANIIAQDLKTESISSKIRKKTRMSILATITQHSHRRPNHSREEKEIKGIQSGKKVKLSLFADNITLYIDNTKDANRKLLKLIMISVKFQDTKLIHRNLLHSYTLTMKEQKEKLRK